MPITRIRSRKCRHIGPLHQRCACLCSHSLGFQGVRHWAAKGQRMNFSRFKGPFFIPFEPPAHLQQTLFQSQYHGGFMNLPTFQRSKPIGGHMTWICSSVSELWLTMVWTDPVLAGQGVSIEWIKTCHCVANIQCRFFLKIWSLLAMWTFILVYLACLLKCLEMDIINFFMNNSTTSHITYFVANILWWKRHFNHLCAQKILCYLAMTNFIASNLCKYTFCIITKPTNWKWYKKIQKFKFVSFSHFLFNLQTPLSTGKHLQIKH